MEKTVDYQIGVHHLFIDFKSAYESVYREKLFGAMMKFVITPKLIRLVKNNNDQRAMLSPDPVSPVGANIYHMWGEARRRTCMPPL